MFEMLPRFLSITLMLFEAPKMLEKIHTRHNFCSLFESGFDKKNFKTQLILFNVVLIDLMAS